LHKSQIDCNYRLGLQGVVCARSRSLPQNRDSDSESGPKPGLRRTPTPHSSCEEMRFLATDSLSTWKCSSNCYRHWNSAQNGSVPYFMLYTYRWTTERYNFNVLTTCSQNCVLSDSFTSS